MAIDTKNCDPTTYIIYGDPNQLEIHNMTLNIFNCTTLKLLYI